MIVSRVDKNKNTKKGKWLPFLSSFTSAYLVLGKSMGRGKKIYSPD
jgi:hypothetical protein